MDRRLNDRERERYRRQMMLPGFTREHQERLKASTVLVAGIGGLGGTAALYLAVAGIGRLVLVHAGDLTLSNMNRQVLMRDDGIGASRVLQGKQTLAGINPDVEVLVHDARMTDDTCARFLEGADLALSARPNFSERLVLNRACAQRRVPLVDAAMCGMEGYLLNVIPRATPCVECVFPEADPEWKELAFPVLGAVSGALGCLMALEAIKVLSGYGEPLLNEMLLMNTLTMEFRKVGIRKDVACPACSGAGAKDRSRDPCLLTVQVPIS